MTPNAIWEFGGNLNLSSEDLWSLATLIMACLAAALVGVSLFLRRLSLLGDALSHAVLPGVIAAAVVSGSTSTGFVVTGALVAALISVGIVQILNRAGLSTEGALGVTFTSFFALGIIGLNLFGQNVDLDPGCILYGSLELVALETVSLHTSLGLGSVFGVTEFPRAALSSFFTLLAVFVVIISRRRSLMVAAFEPERAAVTNSHLSNTIETLLFLSIAAAAVVNSFFAIGAVATTGILITPAVIARLLVTSMSGMWIVTGGMTILICVLGFAIAYIADTPVAGAVSVVGLLLVTLAALFSPHDGLVTRAWRAFCLRLRVSSDDFLADLYRSMEGTRTRPPRVAFLTRVFLILRRKITLRGLLTETGLLKGQSLVRSHRVWERYLASQLNLPLDHVHELSDHMEHFLTNELTERVAQTVSATGTDPHGRQIPPQPNTDSRRR